MHRRPLLCALAVALAFSGCAGSGPRVAPAGPKTHSVSAEDGLNWDTRMVPARELVFRAANRFCAKRKLVMVPVSLDVRPGEQGVRAGTADLVFRALQPGDPAISRSEAVFRYYDPMVVRESVVSFGPDGTERPARNNP